MTYSPRYILNDFYKTHVANLIKESLYGKKLFILRRSFKIDSFGHIHLYGSETFGKKLVTTPVFTSTSREIECRLAQRRQAYIQSILELPRARLLGLLQKPAVPKASFTHR